MISFLIISNCCVTSDNRAVLDYIIVVLIAIGFNTPEIIRKWSQNTLSNTFFCVLESIVNLLVIRFPVGILCRLLSFESRSILFNFVDTGSLRMVDFDPSLWFRFIVNVSIIICISSHFSHFLLFQPNNQLIFELNVACWNASI